jgi:hypothetical protein
MRDSGQCRNYDEELLPESTRSLKEVQHILMYAVKKFLASVDPDPEYSKAVDPCWRVVDTHN